MEEWKDGEMDGVGDEIRCQMAEVIAQILNTKQIPKIQIPKTPRRENQE